MKNFNFQRFTKYALILGVAVFVMGLTPVHADTFYTISGTFDNGSALTGTVSVDSTGAITGVSFTIGTGTGVSTAISFSSLVPGSLQELSTGVFMVAFNTSGITGQFPAVVIVFSAGTICSEASTNCGGDSTSFSLDGNNFTMLTLGSAVPTPEPAPFLLLGSGLLGLALLGRKRLAATANA